MEDLKQWFLDKMKNFYRSLKSKISEAISKRLPSSYKTTRDISIDGEVVFRKGTPISKVNAEINRNLSLVNRDTEIIIRECKNGVIDITKRKSQEAVERKKKVMKRIKLLFKTVALIKVGTKAYKLQKLLNKHNKCLQI